jgi:Na+/melibiose symporter-like transporter
MARLAMLALRYGLPLLLFAVGLAGAIIGGGNNATGAVGVGLMIIALMVWMINWMFRLSVESNRDREREERARDEFVRTGRWPGEDGP